MSSSGAHIVQVWVSMYDRWSLLMIGCITANIQITRLTLYLLFPSRNKFGRFVNLYFCSFYRCCISLQKVSVRRKKKDYGSWKGKITNVGVNTQHVHKYLAFIHTHLKGVTLFRFQIGVISCVAPHYVRVLFCFFPSFHKSLRQEKLVLRESWEEHVEEKLIINT